MAVTVTIELRTQGEETLRVLSRALPATRSYEGCRYVTTHVDRDDPHRVLLVQGWDSREHQERYIAWRQSTGDLAALVNTLSQPPVTHYWALDPA
ncbi:MAG: putative quinol monooxygenase [Kineosporiaceae bacterium]